MDQGFGEDEGARPLLRAGTQSNENLGLTVSA